MGYEGRASWRQLAGALALGHVAAALGFSTLAMMFTALFDPDASMPPTTAWVWSLTKVGAFFGVLMPIVMLPASLLTAPIICFAALKLRPSAGKAVAIGAVVGALEVGLLFAGSGELSGPWSRAGAPGDPRTNAAIIACGAAAGMAYAWVVWHRCVRPYLDRGEE